MAVCETNTCLSLKNTGHHRPEQIKCKIRIKTVGKG